MREVRVKVKFTNACDEAMVRRGFLTQEQVRTCTADALVDTGAIRTKLPAHLVQQLGLVIVGQNRFENDAGLAELTELVGIEISGRHTTEEALALGTEVIIGRTVLAGLDLVVDRVNQQVIANPAHPNGPVLRV